MDLICQDIHFGLGEKKIIKESLRVEGIISTILGLNGSTGKASRLNSSIVRKKADKGLISLDGSLNHGIQLKKQPSKWSSLS